MPKLSTREAVLVAYAITVTVIGAVVLGAMYARETALRAELERQEQRPEEEPYYELLEGPVRFAWCDEGGQVWCEGITVAAACVDGTGRVPRCQRVGGEMVPLCPSGIRAVCVRPLR